MELSSTSVVVERLKEKEEGLFWVPEEVKVDISKDLSIDEQNIVSEMEKQPMLAAYYGTLASELRSQLNRKEENLKALYNMVCGKFRSEREAEKKKCVQAQVDEHTYASPEYLEALQDLQLTRFHCLKAESWSRAIQQKKDLCVAISYRQNTEMKAL